ncbi:hypothetical protein DFJ77DRAFT_440340 [Powellomyces hirtus]|nr:hypothetical protein DFJ77DRAFT_440340 [Powellomyces hirtus]
MDAGSDMAILSANVTQQELQGAGSDMDISVVSPVPISQQLLVHQALTRRNNPVSTAAPTTIPSSPLSAERGLRLFQLSNDTPSIVTPTSRSTTNPALKGRVSPPPSSLPSSLSPPSSRWRRKTLDPALRDSPTRVDDSAIVLSERVKMQKRRESPSKSRNQSTRCTAKSMENRASSIEEGIYEVKTILDVRRAHAPTPTSSTPHSWPFLTEHTPVDVEYLIAC